MDVSLPSDVQVYKSIVISSSHDRSVHDRYHIISRVNKPMSLVLTRAHAKNRITRANSRLLRSMSRLARANEFIKTLPSNEWYTSTELGIGQSIFIFPNSKQG